MPTRPKASIRASTAAGSSGASRMVATRSATVASASDCPPATGVPDAGTGSGWGIVSSCRDTGRSCQGPWVRRWPASPRRRPSAMCGDRVRHDERRGRERGWDVGPSDHLPAWVGVREMDPLARRSCIDPIILLARRNGSPLHHAASAGYPATDPGPASQALPLAAPGTDNAEDHHALRLPAIVDSVVLQVKVRIFEGFPSAWWPRSGKSARRSNAAARTPLYTSA